MRTTFSSLLLALLAAPPLAELVSRGLAAFLADTRAPDAQLKAIPAIPAGFASPLRVEAAYWLALLSLAGSASSYLLQHRSVQMLCAVLRSASESARKVRTLSAIQTGIQSGSSIAAPL